MEIVALVFAIIAFIKSRDAESKVEKINKQIGLILSKDPSLKLELNQSDVGNKTVTLSENSSDKTDSRDKEEAYSKLGDEEDEEAEKENAFVAWLKRDWLIKLGGLLIILGLLFLLSMAFLGMGPVGKIITGYVIGLTLMTFGFFWARKYVNEGTSVVVVGAAVGILTTYTATTSSFNLLPQFAALVFILLISAVVSLIAFVYKKESVAHLGLIAAFSAPLMTNFGGNDFGALLLYLFVTTLGVLWLTIATDWRSLIFTSQVGVFLYSLPYIEMFSYRSNVELNSFATGMVFAFGVLFFSIATLSLLKNNSKQKTVDVIVAMVNAIYAVVWIFNQESTTVQSIMLLFVALLYASGTFFIFRITNDVQTFLLYFVAALSMVMLATFIQFGADARLFLLASQAVFATYFIKKLLQKENDAYTAFIVIVNAVPVYLLLWELFSKVQPSPLTTISVIGLYILLSRGLYLIKTPLYQLFAWVSALLSVVFIWQFTHEVFSDEEKGFATFISLMIYTLSGLFVMYLGATKPSEYLTKIGRAVLGIVALRVIFIDAWSTGETIIGIFICTGVGVLLLSSVFITKLTSSK